VMIEQPHPQFLAPSQGVFDAGQSGVRRYHQEPSGSGSVARATGQRDDRSEGSKR
jgi:hypothetical protein